jgi:hypothetical protein
MEASGQLTLQPLYPLERTSAPLTVNDRKLSWSRQPCQFRSSQLQCFKIFIGNVLSRPYKKTAILLVRVRSHRYANICGIKLLWMLGKKKLVTKLYSQHPKQFDPTNFGISVGVNSEQMYGCFLVQTWQDIAYVCVCVCVCVCACVHERETVCVSRVIQEKRSILWEMTVMIIVRKKII